MWIFLANFYNQKLEILMTFSIYQLQILPTIIVDANDEPKQPIQIIST